MQKEDAQKLILLIIKKYHTVNSFQRLEDELVKYPYKSLRFRKFLWYIYRSMDDNLEQLKNSPHDSYDTDLYNYLENELPKTKKFKSSPTLKKIQHEMKKQ